MSSFRRVVEDIPNACQKHEAVDWDTSQINFPVWRLRGRGSRCHRRLNQEGKYLQFQLRSRVCPSEVRWTRISVTISKYRIVVHSTGIFCGPTLSLEEKNTYLIVKKIMIQAMRPYYLHPKYYLLHLNLFYYFSFNSTVCKQGGWFCQIQWPRIPSSFQIHSRLLLLCFSPWNEEGRGRGLLLGLYTTNFLTKFSKNYQDK